MAKKTETVNKINGLSSLKPEEVNKFNKEVNEARSVQEVDDVLAKATQTSSTNKANQQAQLIKSKNDAKNQVSGLVSLNNQQKELLLKEIDEADSEQKVQTALVKANQAQLVSKKTEVKNEINDLVDLTPEQKTALLKEVEVADSTQKAEAVLEKAKTLVQTNKTSKRLLLQQQANSKKIEANNQVDQLADLSDNDKNKFKEQIANSSSQEDINKVLEQANQLNNQNKAKKEKELVEKKNTSSSEIDALTSLTEQQKTEFKNKINSATSKEDVDTISEQANQANQKAKDDAMKAFNNQRTLTTTYLTDSLNDQKYIDGKTQLQKDIKSIDELVKESSSQNSFKYNEAKEKLENALTNAKKHIEKVNKANETENKLEVTKLQYQASLVHNIKNLLLLITGKNINTRFTTNPTAKLIIKNSKNDIVYFDPIIVNHIENDVFRNTETKIDFEASIKGRKNMEQDVEIDKIILEIDQEYHIVDLKGKTLKFNGTKTDGTVDYK
ncbi:hypothetical protein [Ureaplasma diversum]|uniref:hypothetical protein n=1 Tax=Ureaplasma diversum TaxID=42094 RepID=UPI0038CD66C4